MPKSTPAPSSTTAALFCLLVLCGALPSSGQLAWTLRLEQDITNLAVLDLQTAETEPAAEVDLEVVNAMTRGPSGDLYILGAALFGEIDSTLYRLDPVSFELEEIGPLGLPNPPFVKDIAALPDGRLLMSAEVGVPAGLYVIDPATADTTLVAETDEPILTLATLGDRVLAGYRNSDDEYGLYAVDPGTAALTFLHPLPDNLFGFSNAMATGLDGRLYISGDFFPPVTPPILFRVTSTIDPSTGESEIFTSSSTADFSTYRGLTLIDASLAVAIPVGSPVGQMVLLTLLLISGLAAIRYRL
ncbi:MAG: hypothetical protein AAGM22_17165 [Acidobacteriota bacterium]